MSPQGEGNPALEANGLEHPAPAQETEIGHRDRGALQRNDPSVDPHAAAHLLLTPYGVGSGEADSVAAAGGASHSEIRSASTKIMSPIGDWARRRAPGWGATSPPLVNWTSRRVGVHSRGARMASVKM